MRRVFLYVLPGHEILERTSPTAINTIGRCIRQHAYHKLVGIRTYEIDDKGVVWLESRWLTLGKEVHRNLQNYMNGYPVELDTLPGKRALAGLHLLPVPQMCQQIETEQTIAIDTRRLLPDVEPIEVRGSRDMACKIGGQWALYDYKTSRGDKRKKDPWGYQITPEKLLADPQGNIYALDLMWRYGLESVPARWVTILTDLDRHPDARATDVVFHRTEVEARCREFFLRAEQFRRVARQFKVRPFDINLLPQPDDAAVCEGYGGCAYRSANGGPCRNERTLGEMYQLSKAS